MKNRKEIVPLTSKQYVNKHDAAVCPVCRGSHLSANGFDCDGSSGSGNVVCLTCGSQWTNIWMVTGYSNLNENLSETDLKEIKDKAITFMVDRLTKKG